MIDKRSRKDRRVNKERRKGDIASYNGTENRGTKQQRSNKDRRDTNSNSLMKGTSPPGNESRRIETDQRQFSYAGILPERRSGKDRRGSAKNI